MESSKPLKIAFVVGSFPQVSETFIIDQVVGLLERGHQVTIFSLRRGEDKAVSDKYFKYALKSKTIYLDYPSNYLMRLLVGLWKVVKILWRRPTLLSSVFNFSRFGANAWSLKLLFWVEPWLKREDDFDLVHCHFGTVANKYLVIKGILGLRQKMIATFYGYDASHIFKVKGKDYYQELIAASERILVMSNNMKERLVNHGFPAGRVEVLPVGIPIADYPFLERKRNLSRPVNLCSVGRFVEKKGFDDLFRALALVKAARPGTFTCEVVGGGPLETQLKAQVTELDLDEEVKFLGYKKIEEIIQWFLGKDLFIQPSKTAANGDME